MTATALHASLLGTTTLGGRYRPIRRIGSGGMGTVWEADDLVLQRRVAVKLLSPSLSDDERVSARFRREAQAAGRLVHPNIAAVFDYGEEQGCPFIVMELVPGSDLRRVLAERTRLPVPQAVAVARQIADALAAAHAEGIVHRDVKPGNVMVPGDDRVKVMDFGIADASWFEPITDTGTVMATARYISPEQATGGAATPASDVYSLGVVLYEMLAGRPPFQGPSPLAVAAGHAYEVPAAIGDLVASLPDSVENAVEVAMHKDPRERPSAAVLAARLRDGEAQDRTAALPAATTPSTDGQVAPTLSLPRREHRRTTPVARVPVAALLAVLILVGVAAAVAFRADDGDGLRSRVRPREPIAAALAPGVRAETTERGGRSREAQADGARAEPRSDDRGPDGRAPGSGGGPGSAGRGNAYGHGNGKGGG